MGEKDKNLIRAVPGHICMAEAVPFGQRFTYHTEHSIEDVLSSGYFLTVRSYFETGDELRVVRIENGRVQAIVDLMAIEARGEHLEFCQLTPIVYTAELAQSRQALAALRERRPGTRPKDQSHADPTAEERAKRITQCLSHWDIARVADLVEGCALSQIRAAEEAATLREREKYEAVAENAENEGCTAAGCDEDWHSMKCPLGIAAAIRARGGG